MVLAGADPDEIPDYDEFLSQQGITQDEVEEEFRRKWPQREVPTSEGPRVKRI